MAAFNEMNDWELLALLRAGKHAAYVVIYKRYWAILFRHALKMLKDDEEAKDVVQDVFTVLWTKGADLNVNVNLSSFLYSAIRNRVLDLIAKNKVRGNYLAQLDRFIDNGSFSTDDLIREKELAANIEAEIAHLPTKMREVFELSRKANFSYKQIAQELGISDNTVKKQINNALKILKLKFGIFIFFF